MTLIYAFELRNPDFHTSAARKSRSCFHAVNLPIPQFIRSKLHRGQLMSNRLLDGNTGAAARTSTTHAPRWMMKQQPACMQRALIISSTHRRQEKSAFCGRARACVRLGSNQAAAVFCMRLSVRDAYTIKRH
jgi:hypothetical protein